MCKLGGIVLLHTKKGWKVEEWEKENAPEHEHFAWDMQKWWIVQKEDWLKIYPELKYFRVGEGILIGARHDMSLISVLPYYLLDGIVLKDVS